MNQHITPDKHSSLVGGSTAARRIGCPRGFDVEWYTTARGEHWRHTPAVLRSLLLYEPDTGRLIWKARSRFLGWEENARLGWNSTYAGTEAFTSKTTAGYLKGRLLGKTYTAHRVAWAVFYGHYPKHEVDHVNHRKGDNRIQNLRDVTATENQKNRQTPRHNKSGMIGVLWDRGRCKWRVYAYADKKRWTVGYHDCWARAYAARREIERVYGYHRNHGRGVNT